jgi:hypothetical protein
VALGGIGGFGEGDLLAQGAKDFVGAQGFGSFALGSQAAGGGLDAGGVELVQLLDVSDDFRDLWGEGF